MDVGPEPGRTGEVISGPGEFAETIGRPFLPGQPLLMKLVAVDVDRLTLHDLADPWRSHPDDLGQHPLRDAAAHGQRDRPGLQIPQFAEVTVNGGDPVRGSRSTRRKSGGYGWVAS